MSQIVPYNNNYLPLAKSFRCGNIFLDTFLNSPDALNKNICKTYIFLSDDELSIMGFYSISTGCVEQEDSGLTFRIGGSVHINAFALDERYHGWETKIDGFTMNLSDVLFCDCLDRIISLQERVGFAFVTLNATTMGYSLYKRNDFEELEDDMRIPKDKDESDCIPMYMSLEIIEE